MCSKWSFCLRGWWPPSAWFVRDKATLWWLSRDGEGGGAHEGVALRSFPAKTTLQAVKHQSTDKEVWSFLKLACCWPFKCWSSQPRCFATNALFCCYWLWPPPLKVRWHTATTATEVSVKKSTTERSVLAMLTTKSTANTTMPSTTRPSSAQPKKRPSSTTCLRRKLNRGLGFLSVRQCSQGAL